MVHAIRGGDDMLPTLRYVFDEAHHVFDAADTAFSLRLSGMEAAEMRRWLVGTEDVAVSRRRGLTNRLGDLLDKDPSAQKALAEIARSARLLPGAGWQTRLACNNPIGPVEAFLVIVRQQVLARSRDGDPAYTLETDVRPLLPGLLGAAEFAHEQLGRLTQPLTSVITALHERLDAEAASLDSSARQRIESLARAVQRRAFEPLVGWRAMLQTLSSRPQEAFVDFLAVERSERREIDVGYHRHWLDPMRPFAEAVLVRAHGVLMTSATLRDTSADGTDGWDLAELMTGTCHLPVAIDRLSLPSPFDYVGRTRVLVVTDVERSDPRQVAAAYRELFLAAGGGALGLFTAISRLRAVHGAIAPALEAVGIRLLAQHVDTLDIGTMIDIFRDEADSCLLGTDAVRDGIDVPGRALRLIVFDRVPWPRPSLLHRARREAFGRRRYEEMLTRLRLKQAYGRLMRKANDRGVFVMLDRQLPTRLTAAFPAGVDVTRTGLANAVTTVRTFLRSG
jgi:ATP-dependent DNA helicase DinG